MASSLRDLITKWTLVVNGEALEKLNAGLDKAKEKTHKLGEEKEGMEKLAHSMEGVKDRLDLIIGYEALKGLAEMAERFAKLGENIKVTASSLGLGIEEFQKLSWAAQLSAVSQEQLSTGMLRLSRALFDAKTGSTEAQMIFAHLGIPPGQVSQLHNASDALIVLSSRLQTMQDPIAKLALVQKTLGRGSMEMVAFLQQGPAAIQEKMRQASRDGLILSESQVEGLERMNHAFEKLESKLRVIGANFIAPLAPVVEKLVDDFTHFFNVNKDWIGLNVEAFTLKIVYALGWLDGFITTFVGNLKKHFGNTGLLGAIFGDIAVVGTALTALAGVVTVIKLIGGVMEATGITKLLGLAGRAGKGILGAIFGGGEAAAAGGAAEAAAGGLATEGAVAGGGGLAALVTGAMAPLAAAIAGAFLGAGFDKVMDKVTKGGFSNVVGKPGELLAGMLGPSDAEIFAQAALRVQQTQINNGQTTHQQNTTTFNVHGVTDAHEVARTVKKHIDDHHNQVLRETARGVQGAKVGSE